MTGTEEATMDTGEKRLNELGYKQELRREMVRTYSSCSLVIRFYGE